MVIVITLPNYESLFMAPVSLTLLGVNEIIGSRQSRIPCQEQVSHVSYLGTFKLRSSLEMELSPNGRHRS